MNVLVTGAAIILLVLLGGYVSAAETVLTRLELVRALRLDEEDAVGSRPLLWLMEHRASAMNVVLMLTVTFRVTLTALATVVATDLAGGVVGVVLAVVGVVIVSLVLGEVVPRSVTLRHLEATGLRLARSLVVVVRSTSPLARLFVAVGRAMSRSRSDTSGPYPEHSGATGDDLVELLDAEAEDDEIEEDERAMIHSIFELGDTVAREIMVPRPDMVTVAGRAPLREVVNLVIEHGYSRLPVHRDSRDDIIGVIYAKDLLKRLAMRPGSDHWSDLVRPATYVPETKRVDTLLRSLQESTVHLAMVVDEYGALVGLVTIEDILEEIVGEIVDEHDHEEPLVEVIEAGQVRVDARLPVDELNELMDTHLPDEAWDTVGGLVIGTLGRVPDQGEAVDIDGLTLETERVQGRRVSKVLVTRRAVDAAP